MAAGAVEVIVIDDSSDEEAGPAGAAEFSDVEEVVEQAMPIDDRELDSDEEVAIIGHTGPVRPAPPRLSHALSYSRNSVVLKETLSSSRRGGRHAADLPSASAYAEHRSFLYCACRCAQVSIIDYPHARADCGANRWGRSDNKDHCANVRGPHVSVSRQGKFVRSDLPSSQRQERTLVAPNTPPDPLRQCERV